MTMFLITDDRPEYGRLKSYSATTKGEKVTLRLEVELASPDDLGYILRSLAQLKKAHAAKRPSAKPSAPEPRKIAADKRLALPPPDRDG